MYRMSLSNEAEQAAAAARELAAFTAEMEGRTPKRAPAGFVRGEVVRGLGDVFNGEDDEEAAGRGGHVANSGRIFRGNAGTALGMGAGREEARRPAETVVDPESTNLFVGGLPGDVTDSEFFGVFEKFGPIAAFTVKRPRPFEVRENVYGFVSFMKREHAEMAQRLVNESVLRGFQLRVNWAKKAAGSVYPLHVSKAGIVPLVAWPMTQDSLSLPVPNTYPSPSVMVHVPEDERQKNIIDKLALNVARFGHKFEESVIKMYGKDPAFAFLFEKDTLLSVYYQWRVYAYLQGDGDKKWRTEPFQMVAGGPWWAPPAQEKVVEDEPMEITFVNNCEEEKEEVDDENRTVLTAEEKEVFGVMLGRISTSTLDICDAMVFALDHAVMAEEIVKMVVESLSKPDETRTSQMVARLFLISDILHNSSTSAHNAFAYRTLFEPHLEGVFENIRKMYHSMTGRLTANYVKEQVVQVIKSWEQWGLYSGSLMGKLRQGFD